MATPQERCSQPSFVDITVYEGGYMMRATWGNYTPSVTKMTQRKNNCSEGGR